jgi:hypothetical protein
LGAEIESINRQIDIFDLAPPHLSLQRRRGRLNAKLERLDGE